MTRMNSPAATALGTLCFIGTLVVLFGHIHHIADLTITHLYILLALVVALGAGHFMWHSKGATMVSFCVLAIAATFAAVILSGGRGLASFKEKQEQARTHNEARAKLKVSIADKQRELDDAKAAVAQAQGDVNSATSVAADQCATGKGSRCAGSSTGIDLKRARAEELAQARDAINRDYAGLVLRYEQGQDVNAAGELQALVDFASLVTGASPEKSLAVVTPLISYLFALITEFGTITFLNHGLTRVPSQITKQAPPPIAPTVQRLPADLISLTDIATELNMDARLARKRVRELGITKPLQGWSFAPDVADDIKKRLSSASFH